MNDEKKEIRQLHVDLPDELYARLQAFARADKRTVRAVVEMALVDFFQGNSRPVPDPSWMDRWIGNLSSK